MGDFTATLIILAAGWILVAATVGVGMWAICRAAGIADDEARQPRG